MTYPLSLSLSQFYITMDPYEIIDKFYTLNSPLRNLLIIHSEKVAEKALNLIHEFSISGADKDFVYQSAMLHDIGIFRCYAPSIFCEGELPYICHGVVGSDILYNLGLPRHALVCERHTGSGITTEEIIRNNMPLPHRDFIPVSIEEKLICYADKFFSKSGNPEKELSLDHIINSIHRHGEGPYQRFLNLHLEITGESIPSNTIT